MSYFIVRKVGWVFDDDWYNYDGDHDVEGVYHSEKEAKDRVNLLNHIYFLYWGFMSRPFQVKYNAQRQYEFVSRDELAVLVSKYLEVEISELYNPKKGFIWRNESEYLRKLSREQVSNICSKININFFKYYKNLNTKIML